MPFRPPREQIYLIFELLVQFFLNCNYNEPFSCRISTEHSSRRKETLPCYTCSKFKNKKNPSQKWRSRIYYLCEGVWSMRLNLSPPSFLSYFAATSYLFFLYLSLLSLNESCSCLGLCSGAAVLTFLTSTSPKTPLLTGQIHSVSLFLFILIVDSSILHRD